MIQEDAEKLIDILERAKVLLSFSNWEREGHYAVNQFGKGTNPESLYATGYCAVGAIWSVGDNAYWSGLATSLLQDASFDKHNKPAAHFNDYMASSKDDIFDLYDATIETILNESMWWG